MVEIDVKDRKILYQLSLDSRQSFRSIGRKIGLSKDTVAARVKKLQDDDIILCFYTYFDYFRLGLIPLRFYFKYQYITPEIRKAIVENFANYEKSSVVCSIEGSYDLVVLLLVKNITEIYPFWQQTLKEFGNYFREIVFSVYQKEWSYDKYFLIDGIEERTKSVLKRGGNRMEYDDLDLKILIGIKIS